jgi:hypothetical protein
MKAIRKTVILTLLLALGAALSVRAEDEPAPTPKPKPTPSTTPAPKKPIQQQLAGRVIKVDRLTRNVTLQVNSFTYVLQITDFTRVIRSGKEKDINDVIVGEEVTVNVILRELASGRIEVAVLSVELPETVAAQGQTRGTWYTQPPPFVNGPNPANVDGPIISPHR